MNTVYNELIIIFSDTFLWILQQTLLQFRFALENFTWLPFYRFGILFNTVFLFNLSKPFYGDYFNTPTSST